MLAKRVIPCMDVKDGRVVKGVNFVNLRDAGDPIELAQRYDEERADEVIFLDITATSDGRATTVGLASRASEQLHLPYCVGGGFRSVADIRTMIAAGADKVSVNSAAVADPSLITQAAAAFGSQAILCAIDAKQVAGNPNKWEVYVHGGRKATGIDAVAWAAEAARRGAGEILLTSMDRDGSRDGFDCALTRAVARAVDIPVIASGGVGKLEHFAQGVIEGEADAVLAAASSSAMRRSRSESSRCRRSRTSASASLAASFCAASCAASASRSRSAWAFARVTASSTACSRSASMSCARSCTARANSASRTCRTMSANPDSSTLNTVPHCGHLISFTGKPPSNSSPANSTTPFPPPARRAPFVLPCCLRPGRGANAGERTRRR